MSQQSTEQLIEKLKIMPKAWQDSKRLVWDQVTEKAREYFASGLFETFEKAFFEAFIEYYSNEDYIYFFSEELNRNKK